MTKINTETKHAVYSQAKSWRKDNTKVSGVISAKYEYRIVQVHGMSIIMFDNKTGELSFLVPGALARKRAAVINRINAFLGENWLLWQSAVGPVIAYADWADSFVLKYDTWYTIEQNPTRLKVGKNEIKTLLAGT